MNFPNQVRQPKLSNIELIAMEITANSINIDSDYQLLRIIPHILKSKIEQNSCNHLKNSLLYRKIQIREQGCHATQKTYYYGDTSHAICNTNDIFSLKMPACNCSHFILKNNIWWLMKNKLEHIWALLSANKRAI